MIFRVEGQPVPDDLMENWRTWLIDVSPDFFRTLRVPLIAGRPLSTADRTDAPLTVVANEAFVRKFMPGQSAVGKRVSTGGALGEHDLRWAEIVGVVGSLHQAGLDQDAAPTLYRSFQQEEFPTGLRRVNLVVRTSGEPVLLTSPIEKMVASMDRDQPVFDVRTMEQRLADSIVSRRFDAALTGTFASIAVLLACIGVYGVMSYLVTLRTSELGIRLALGAQRRQLLISIFREGITLAIIGAVFGITGAFILSRYLSTLLFGVGTHDPATFITASAALVGAVIAACAIPGRRASQVDPVSALRHG
jgi:putative ABC transport system permease protein